MRLCWQEIESLLRYASAPARFLETPAPEMVAGAARRSAPSKQQMVDRQLGPYTIVAPLGAGGMGEVYRARDSKLGREVAIKVLPPHFMSDPERRARFAREARALATLNHPHIGAIYGLEEAEGVTALVLELVEGPTLADRLARGPLPVSAALAIARQIADALDAAHEKGIVHRDLKPANIVLQGGAGASGPTSGDARAKVLDFGLAKTMAVGLEGDLTQRASGALDGTAEGRILGTPAYMSPEQARGQAVDKRTDIWAFGCVLFEMLTGQRTVWWGHDVRHVRQHSGAGARLVGATRRDTRVHPYAARPMSEKRSAEAAARHCGRVHRHRRPRPGAVFTCRSPASPRSSYSDGIVNGSDGPSRSSLALALLGAVSVLVVQVRRQHTVADPVEYTIGAPDNWLLAGDAFTGSAPSFAIAPDGRHVAVVAFSQGLSMLWVRSITRPPWRRLEGTEGASSPFWSPDSQSIGFFASAKLPPGDAWLKTVRVSGGLPVELCGVPHGERSAAWNRGGVIIFGGSGGLQKIPSAGGNPSPVTKLQKGENAHRWPWFLPDAEHFIYLAHGPAVSELRVGSLVSTDTWSLGPFESNAMYARGHLLFVRGGKFMAQSFDTATRKLAGDPVVLADQTAVLDAGQRGLFSVSEAGVLAYSSWRRPPSQLTWMDRTGKSLGAAGDPGFYVNLGLSLDDRHVAVSQVKEQPGAQSIVDIWLIDLARAGAASRLTDHPAWEFDPAWSPDGQHVAFNSSRLDPLRSAYSLFVRPSNGSGRDDLLVKSETLITAPDWSPDGRFLVYGEQDAATGVDLWSLPLSGARTKSVFLQTAHDEASGTFSPDGRWIAYESNASGRSQVYVRPFPVQEGQFPISRDGGRAPRWSGDGTELFFLTPDGMLMAAGIDTTKAFAATVPQPLFRTGLTNTGSFHPYAVARDGRRFLIPVPREIAGSTPITVVLNWPATLGK